MRTPRYRSIDHLTTARIPSVGSVKTVEHAGTAGTFGTAGTVDALASRTETGR